MPWVCMLSKWQHRGLGAWELANRNSPSELGASEDGAEAAHAGGDASGDAGADASGGDASGGADLAARTADLRKNALAFMIKR